jgi:hypothetical protein
LNTLSLPVVLVVAAAVAGVVLVVLELPLALL